jgi:hypothetical protein
VTWHGSAQQQPSRSTTRSLGTSSTPYLVADVTPTLKPLRNTVQPEQALERARHAERAARQRVAQLEDERFITEALARDAAYTAERTASTARLLDALLGDGPWNRM